jgi:AraC-like DNA-binding protein
MRRARLHEAALRADGGEPVDWAALAADLGYADQAHLTREFTATIGVPPSRYRSLRCFGLYVVWPTTETMPERTSGNASGERLTAGDYL